MIGLFILGLLSPTLLPEKEVRSFVTTGGGQVRPKKRKQFETQTPSGAAVTTVAELERLLDICTDTQFAKVIQDLPATLLFVNPKGDIITKRMLKKTTWGAYRDGLNILTFQQAILSTKPHSPIITQHDTQMAQSIVQHNEVWTKRINNPLIDTTQLLLPLHKPITIM
jgi:hypothetical protein